MQPSAASVSSELPAVLRGEGLGGAHPARRGVEQLDSGLGRRLGPDVPRRQPRLERGGSAPCGRRRSAGRRATAHRGSRGCRRPDGRLPCGSPSSARPCSGTARAGRPRRSRRRSKSISPSCAAARMCSTVFVEPPMATSSAIAFSKAVPRGDVARQRARVVVVVPAAAEVHDGAAGLEEQLAPGRVRGQRRAVARQGEAEGLGQAVHRVRGEHARARPAGRAGGTLDEREPGVVDLRSTPTRRSR